MSQETVSAEPEIPTLLALEVLHYLVHGKIVEHPLPWKIETDWTTEVHDAHGKIVMKFPNGLLAEAFIKLATVIDRDNKAFDKEFEEMCK